MTRKKRIPEPPASVRAQRSAQGVRGTSEHWSPHFAPDANRSFHRIDELDAQNSWQVSRAELPGQVEHETHIAAGRIKIR